MCLTAPGFMCATQAFCEVPGCGNQIKYKWKKDTGRNGGRCEKHREEPESMVHTRPPCVEEGCLTAPSYNYKGKSTLSSSASLRMAASPQGQLCLAHRLASLSRCPTSRKLLDHSVGDY